MRHGLFANRCFVFALLTSMSVSLFAADETVTEQAYLQEFPVVLTASRLAQHISEAPNAVTVIDRLMIKASGFRTIAELVPFGSRHVCGECRGKHAFRFIERSERSVFPQDAGVG